MGVQIPLGLFMYTYSLKRNIAVKGKILDAGSQILRGHTSAYNSDVYRACARAGHVFKGYSQMQQFAVGTLGVNTLVRVINMHRYHLYPGGSSCGISYDLYAKHVDVCVVTDTGGSCRVPAAMCNAYGFKPSFGAISRYGVVPLCDALDTVSLASLNFNAIRSFFSDICVRFKQDHTQKQVPRMIKQMPRVLYRIREFQIGLCAQARANYLRAIIALRAHVKIQTISIGAALVKQITKIYSAICASNFYSSTYRYDGVRFTHNRYYVRNLCARTRAHNRAQYMLKYTKKRLCVRAMPNLRMRYAQFCARACERVNREHWYVFPTVRAYAHVCQSHRALQRIAHDIDVNNMLWNLLHRPALTMPGNLQISAPNLADFTLLEFVNKCLK